MFKRRNGKRKWLCYIKTRLVFTDKQEELEKYIRAASKIYFGLSPEETRNLSIQCAKRAFDWNPLIIGRKRMYKFRMVCGVHETTSKYVRMIWLALKD